MGRCYAPNPTRPVGRLPLIVSYILISLKAYSTLHSKFTHTHTHTHTHTLAYIQAYNMAPIIPKTLTYIYHANHIIIFKVATKQTCHIQSRNIGMLRSNKQVIISKAKHSKILFMFIKARSRSYLKQMHVHVNA